MKTKTTDLKQFITGFLFTCIASTLTYAQNVGINATGNAPDASAMLDVSATNKGLLIPRLALTGTTDATTIPSPTTSLLVYNTATAGGVTPGYYYNSGTAAVPIWTPFSTPSKFTVSFGNKQLQIIDATPSPYCGPNTSGTNNTNYGNPATLAPNSPNYITEAIFCANSNCTFNGLNGYLTSTGSGIAVTVSLYRFRPISGSSAPMGDLVGSTSVTVTNSSNVFSFSIPAPTTAFTAQPGDLFLLFLSRSSSTNAGIYGSMEFTNN